MQDENVSTSPAQNVSSSPPKTSAPPRPRESGQHQPHTKPCGSPAYGHQQKDSGHPAATQKATKTARQKPTKNILIFFKKPIDKQNPLVYNNQARKQWLVGQAVKTLASHAENMGSIPVRVTIEKRIPHGIRFFYVMAPRTSSNTARTRHAWLVPWVRICHLEIGKLVCQAESERIFAKRNSRSGYHTVSVFSILWCLVRHRTHSHERQDWHLYLVKPNPFQRTKRANWVRTLASPFPVGSSQGEADSRTSHLKRISQFRILLLL